MQCVQVVNFIVDARSGFSQETPSMDSNRGYASMDSMDTYKGVRTVGAFREFTQWTHLVVCTQWVHTAGLVNEIRAQDSFKYAIRVLCWDNLALMASCRFHHNSAEHKRLELSLPKK